GNHRRASQLATPAGAAGTGHAGCRAARQNPEYADQRQEIIMTIPRATVRLQFHESFTLNDAIPLVDYFAELGISHVYASPLTVARAGSNHGYDTIDYSQVSPVLGGEDALRRLVQKLRAVDMGLILDIVPNHMASSSSNAWWWDVLEWGKNSR